MGLVSRRSSLGLVAALALVVAGWRLAGGVAASEGVAALEPGAGAAHGASAPGAPSLAAPGAAPAGAGLRSTAVEPPASARVPVEDSTPAPGKTQASFFDLRGLGTLAGTLEVHAADRWAKAPEDSNLRLRIAPTTRIPEFEMSGIFRGQVPLRSMLELGERDGVQRWHFEAGELPCGDYTLTLLPVGASTEVTVTRDRQSHALVTLPPLEVLELHVLEDGRACAARGVRYRPWASPEKHDAFGRPGSGLVSARAGASPGTFVLNATAGEREVTVDLGELGSLRRTVQVPVGGGRATIGVTRRFAVELWIEDEHGRCLRPAWAANAEPHVVAGSAELQSTRALQPTAALDSTAGGDLRGSGLRAFRPREDPDAADAALPPEAEPGPAVVWYFSGPGTAEITVVPQRGWGERTTLTASIGAGAPTRATLRVRRPEPGSDRAVDLDRLRLLRGRIAR